VLKGGMCNGVDENFHEPFKPNQEPAVHSTGPLPTPASKIPIEAWTGGTVSKKTHEHAPEKELSWDTARGCWIAAVVTWVALKIIIIIIINNTEH
jgi:hypothetical protein